MTQVFSQTKKESGFSSKSPTWFQTKLFYVLNDLKQIKDPLLAVFLHNAQAANFTWNCAVASNLWA